LPIAHFDLLFADLENKAKTTLVSRTNDHFKKKRNLLNHGNQ
jgi:hypothetical protein